MKILDIKASLHNHSIYSLIDSPETVENYLIHCQERGVEYFALSDHGHMSGMATLMREAPKYGVKPVAGCEFYVDLKPDMPTYGHLTTLAYNDVGVKNLLKLYHLSWSNSVAKWGKKKPMITWEQLEQHSEGLFAGTGCLVSTIARPLLKDQPEIAVKNLERLISIFGKHRLFCELIPHMVTHDFDRETRTFKPNPCTPFAPDGDILKGYQLWVYDEAVVKRGLKPAITLDAHFVKPETHEIQSAILQNGEGGWHFQNCYNFLSPEEMYHRLTYLPNHGEKLHEQMIHTTRDMCSEVIYTPVKKEIHLAFKYDNITDSYADFAKNVDMDRVLRCCENHGKI